MEGLSGRLGFGPHEMEAVHPKEPRVGGRQFPDFVHRKSLVLLPHHLKRLTVR